MIYDKLKKDWDLNKFANTYIIVTKDPRSSVLDLEKFIKDNIFINSVVDIQNNPDYLLIHKEFVNNKEQKYITVSQIRYVIDFFSKTSWNSDKVLVIYEADYLNENASNALLKLLEDAPEKSYIFLIANSLNQIIPTIKSRSRVIYDDIQSAKTINSYNYLDFLLDYSEKDVEKFLKILEQEGGANVWQDFSAEIAFALRNIVLHYANFNIDLAAEEQKLAKLINKRDIEDILKINDKVNFYTSSCLKYDLSKRHIFYLVAEIIRS